MLSVRNPGKVYPVAEDITELDMNMDAEEYNYDGKLAFRGNRDVHHSTEDVDVYWLYDDQSRRIGLVEHAGTEHTALWFRDNEFSTLLQEDWQMHDKTVWSIMTQHVYEDCMRRGTTVDNIQTYTGLTLVRPSDIGGIRTTERCTQCSGPRQPNCRVVQSTVHAFNPYTTLFVNDDGVIHIPPSDSKILTVQPTEYKPLHAGSGT